MRGVNGEEGEEECYGSWGGGWRYKEERVGTRGGGRGKWEGGGMSEGGERRGRGGGGLRELGGVGGGVEIQRRASGN